MKYRELAGTGMRVSELCFGNFIFGSHMWGKGVGDAPEGVRLQNVAFDLGVNFFDTGDAYSNGHAERLMAETIKCAGREKIILSTKFGYDFYSDPGTAPGTAGSHKERKQDFSEKFVMFALEESLKRMGTDHVDLYQAHNLKLPEMTGDLLRVMEKVVASGKARHWGVALGPAIGWREEGVIALTEWAKAGCVTVQTVFNMLEQHPGRELAEIAAERKTAGIIARVPHSSGILQDMYSPDEKFDDHRKFRDRNWLVYGLKKVEMLREIQKRHGGTMGQVAIKWLLTWPAVTSVQPNIMDERELREFAAACDGDLLSAEEMREVQGLAEGDFGLGAEAHACDLKSSVHTSGRVRSGYERGKAVPKTTTT